MSLMCSSDPVAAVSIIDFNAQPKLYSCVFGEGVLNDIVSIVLFNTVLNLQGKPFSKSTPGIIVGQFIAIAIVSTAVGVLFGFVNCLAMKHLRFLAHNAISETFFLIAMGFISYYVTHGIVILDV